MAYKAGSLVVDILANDQVSTTLDKISNKIGSFGKKSNRQSKSGGGTFGFLNIAKWTAVFAVARRFGRTLSTIVQSGADYAETLNLWETAMGSNLNVATEFVNKMNEAYGISEKTLMNAQAIFKNMLGSLGQISDTMAYSLSEGITQMALDYASLYNVTFEQAFTKFQAALAGQVRPIRSVAGYDITENTLFQLYQSLGGTKTMRQLSRTEKQLLSILAIFNQMNASGAVGDLEKTMKSFANQSRVMAEAWQQVKTYAGVVLTKLIADSGLLVNVNAILIFIGDTLKAVAESMGAIEHFGGDIFESTTEGALDASKAMDEVQGKLLDFDKFRAMNSGEENAFGLDEKLSQALSGYATILANASMEARKLAENLKIASGLFNEDGTFNIEKWNELVDTIEAFGHALLAILASKAITGIVNGIKNFTLAGKGLSNILLTGVIFAILQAIDAFRDGEYVTFAIATAIGVVLVGAFVALKIAQYKSLLAQKEHDKQVAVGALTQANYNATLDRYMILLLRANGVSMKKIQWARQDITATRQQAQAQAELNAQYKATQTSLEKQVVSFNSLATVFAGISVLTVGVYSFISAWDDMGGVQKAVGIFTALAGALTAVAIAFHATHNWAKAIGIGAMVAGGALFVTSQLPKFAEGGMPDKGTLFYAGEAGAEMVYNTPSGQSGVANVQQIAQATRAGTLQAVKEWWSQARNDIPQFREVSKTGIYEVAKSEMRRRGEW